METRRILAVFGRILFVVLLGFGLLRDAQAQKRHLVTIRDLQTIKWADYVQLSPSGDRLAYVAGGAIWLVGTTRGSIPHEFVKGAFPEWSPDGKRIAYYSDQAGTFQLWICDIETGRREQVTNLKGGINPDPWTRLVGWIYDPFRYSWSPDGNKLVFASQVPLAQQNSLRRSQGSTLNAANPTGTPLILTTDTPPDWTLHGIFSRGFARRQFVNGKLTQSELNPSESPAPLTANQLFVVDIREKLVEQLTTDGAGYFDPDWSPDGSSIICASNEGTSLVGFGSGTTNIYLVDISSRRKKAVTTGSGNKSLPLWSSDGKWVAYVGAENFGRQSIYIVSTNGGTPFNATQKLDRNIEEFYWSPGGRSLIVIARDGVSWPILQVDIRTGDAARLTPDEAALRFRLSVSSSGEIAWQQSDANEIGVIKVSHPEKGPILALVGLNPQVESWELGEQEVVRWKNHRGDALEGILVKPVHFEKGRKYPLVVDCYPGTGNWFRAEGMVGNQEWASRGYMVFFPNPRSPHTWMNAFRTAAFDRATKGSRGWDITVDDVLSGVDELIKLGLVDPNQMGLYGFSNGGGVVDYLVTQTDRFKCAVSVAGVLPDWSRQFFMNTMDPMVLTMAGVTPWQDPETYVHLSAVYRLDKVEIPMLLADGDEDGDFLLGMIEMYNGLRWLGRDVTLLRYPKQGHGFTGKSFDDFEKRVNAFYDKYLEPQKPQN
jgi:dipeptidyl aminopeptidase/acylaminoacyl peptidase